MHHIADRFINLEIVLYADNPRAAVAEKLDDRTNRPGPVGITFEIIDAQTVRDGDEKYVVGVFRLCEICVRCVNVFVVEMVFYY